MLNHLKPIVADSEHSISNSLEFLEYISNASASDEITEHIDRWNFWIDATLTIDEKAIKDAFRTVIRKEAFTQLKT